MALRLQYGQEVELPMGVLAPPRQEEQDFKQLQSVHWLLTPIRPTAASEGSLLITIEELFISSLYA